MISVSRATRRGSNQSTTVITPSPPAARSRRISGACGRAWAPPVRGSILDHSVTYDLASTVMRDHSADADFAIATKIANRTSNPVQLTG